MVIPYQSHLSAYVSCASRFSITILAKGGCTEAKVAALRLNRPSAIGGRF